MCIQVKIDCKNNDFLLVTQINVFKNAQSARVCAQICFFVQVIFIISLKFHMSPTCCQLTC